MPGVVGGQVAGQPGSMWGSPAEALAIRGEKEGRRRGLYYIDELWRNPVRSTRHLGP